MSITSEIQKGERDAKAKQAAKRRAEKLARSLSVRSAGRGAVRAGKSGGKGIVVKSQKNGRGFSGLVDYSTDPKKRPELVYTNCCDKKDALKSMIQASKRRPDIKQPVGHITLSLPPGAGKDKKRWEQIVEKARSELGIDDSFPCLAVLHCDTEHDHVHLIFSRVAVGGRVHDQANIGLRCASVERVIERDFNLKLFKSPPASPVPVTKNEIEKALREKQQPPRMQIAAALSEAIKGKPAVPQFVERLQLAGISVKANVSQSTGKMSGFSFVLDGVAFGGSKIHKDFSWGNLQKEIEYDEARDNQFLAQLNIRASATGVNLTKSTATIARIAGSPAPTNREITKSGTDDRANTPSSSTPTTHTPATTSATSASAAPAGAPVATTKDNVAKVRGSRLDAVKPSQLNKETNHGTANNHSGSASLKNFGKFKRRAGARGLRPLSKIPLASNLNLDHLLLRGHGCDNVADRSAKGERNSSLRLPITTPRIAKPNLSTPAWQRSAALLKEYHDSVKAGVTPDALDREALKAGYLPEEVINAHAVARGIPHAEAAQRVAESSPTHKVLEYIESEYKQAAQRSAARLAHNLDLNAPKPPAPK